MLPQKFSAAATWMTRLPFAEVTPVAVEHAATAIELTAIIARKDLAIERADDGRFITPEPYNENRFHFKQPQPPTRPSSPVLYRTGAMIGAWPVVRKE
jgi:hypothetical protein